MAIEPLTNTVQHSGQYCRGMFLHQLILQNMLMTTGAVCLGLSTMLTQLPK